MIAYGITDVRRIPAPPVASSGKQDHPILSASLGRTIKADDFNVLRALNASEGHVFNLKNRTSTNENSAQFMDGLMGNATTAEPIKGNKTEEHKKNKGSGRIYERFYERRKRNYFYPIYYCFTAIIPVGTALFLR